MNQNEKEEWKKEALKVLIEYLEQTIGYPNHQDNGLIMQQLPNMWNLLGEKRLIKPGMTYDAFCYFAEKKWMEAEMNRILGL